MARRLRPQGCRLAQLPRHLRCRLGLVRVRDQRRWSDRRHQEGLAGLEHMHGLGIGIVQIVCFLRLLVTVAVGPVMIERGYRGSISAGCPREYQAAFLCQLQQDSLLHS